MGLYLRVARQTPSGARARSDAASNDQVGLIAARSHHPHQRPHEHGRSAANDAPPTKPELATNPAHRSHHGVETDHRRPMFARRDVVDVGLPHRRDHPERSGDQQEGRHRHPERIGYSHTHARQCRDDRPCEDDRAAPAAMTCQQLDHLVARNRRKRHQGRDHSHHPDFFFAQQAEEIGLGGIERPTENAPRTTPDSISNRRPG